MKNGRFVRVKKSHLREDIREAKGMIRELQRGVRRDEKELRVRRYGSYGSPSAKHVERAGQDWEASKAARHKATAHLQSGNCAGAIAQLKNAAFAAGAATSEVHSAVGHAKAMTEERRLITALSERIQAACLRPCIPGRKPSRKGARRSKRK